MIIWVWIVFMKCEYGSRSSHHLTHGKVTFCPLCIRLAIEGLWLHQAWGCWTYSTSALPNGEIFSSICSYMRNREKLPRKSILTVSWTQLQDHTRPSAPWACYILLCELRGWRFQYVLNMHVCTLLQSNGRATVHNICSWCNNIVTALCVFIRLLCRNSVWYFEEYTIHTSGKL